MKILIASDWYKPVINGVVTSVLNLEKELRNKGHEVRILTLAQKDGCEPDERVYYLRSFDAHYIYPNARIAPRISKTMLEKIAAWGPEVVHTQCEFSTFGPALRIAARTGAPVIHTYHTVYENYTHYFSPSKAIGRKMVIGFTRRTLRKTDAVIAPTAKVARMLKGYGVTQSLHVIPTGLELEKFSAVRDEAENRQLREELGISCENRILLCLGRLAKEKRVEELIDFAARMQDEKLTLLIVGGGPDELRLRGLAAGVRTKTQILFTGMVNPQETRRYYHLADLFVSASQSETQGLTYIEALANGLPALCREDECLDGVVVPGMNGYQYRTYEEFVAFLKEILSDDQMRSQMAGRAYRHAVDNFSAEVFAQRAEMVYRAAIAGKNIRKAAVATAG